VTLVWLLAALAVVPLLSLPLTGAIGRRAGYPLGAIFLVIAALLVPAAREVVGGEPLTWTVPWVPELGLDLGLRLDGLSLVFVALALVIGALVFFYSPTYFLSGDQRGFYLIMTGFTFSMVAFVLSDNLVLMFLTWELTSLASFLLIARSGQAGEPASMRTMLMTFIGGITLLAAVGLIIARTGTSDFSVAMTSDVWQTDPLFTAVVAVLVASAGFSKAAQFPFHLWLPDAMAAATPVSAYLHAAAVVKAGIYLLMRFTALFHGVPVWTILLVGVGLFTACLGAWFALQQTDLKKLMAYSTVSQLGLITATIGVGTEFAMAAAVLHTIAHAGFKSGLFMLMGVVDHQAGTRKIDRLPALRRAMPWTFWATVLGLGSMAGVPPLLGFISKEKVLASFLATPGPPAVAIVTLAIAGFGAVLTFAYCGKILTGAFIDGPAPDPAIRDGSWKTVLPAALPIVVGLPLAFVVSVFEAPVLAAVDAVWPQTDSSVSFYLWHGLTIELFVTLLVFALGTFVVLRRARLRPLIERPTFSRDGAEVLAAVNRWLERAGIRLVDLVRADYPSRHIAPMMVSLAVLLGLGSLALWATDSVAPLHPGLNRPIDIGLLVVAAAGTLALCVSRSRIGGAVLLGGVGIGMTVQIFMLGAADVGLTQLLVEVLTVLVIMLVLRKLPLEFSNARHPKHGRNAVIAVGTGLAAGLAAFTVIGRRGRSEVADYYIANAPEVTGGDNIVNVILVEFRALDTFGELVVLGMAGIAIIAVLATIPRRFLDPAPDPSPESPVTFVPEPVIEIDDEGTRARRAIEDPVANTSALRLLRKPLVPVLAVISAVLFWRGHNEPGGGFIAALVAACAVAFVYMAGSDDAPVSRPRLPILLIAGGVLTALFAGFLGYSAGQFLEPLYGYLGPIGLYSSLLFDVGVYTAVLGLVMVAFNVLGTDDDDRKRSTSPVEPQEVNR
jgi:multicomponent Na+:H+ antiporter subunit A